MTACFGTSLKVGDIVSFTFPRREGSANVARPCLVLETEDDEVLLAYGTTSATDANRGLELRVSFDTAACGLHRPTRFVCARRLRVDSADARFVTDRHGSVVLGSLGEDFRERLEEIRRTLDAEGSRHDRIERERVGIHPGPCRDYLRRRRVNRASECEERAAKVPSTVVVIKRSKLRSTPPRMSH